MSEPSGLDVGSCMPGREDLGSDLSCWGATKSSVRAAGLILSVPEDVSDIHTGPIPPSGDAKREVSGQYWFCASF